MSVMFVILVLGLPLFTFATPLLLNTSGNTMKVFIFVVFFHRTSFLFVTLLHIYPHAFLAPTPHPIFVFTILTELALVFLLFAFGTAFLPNAVNGPMSLLIS